VNNIATQLENAWKHTGRGNATGCGRYVGSLSVGLFLAPVLTGNMGKQYVKICKWLISIPQNYNL